MLRKGLDFSEESVEKSWKKNRLTKAVRSSSHVSIVPLSSSSHVFASPEFMNVFVRIGFGSTIELVSFDESQVIAFDGKFVCGFRNSNEKVMEVIDVENWQIDNSRILRWIVSLIEWNSFILSTKSSIQSTFRFRHYQTGIETVVYADSDHAVDYMDRKSTSGICTFVGCCLTSWFSKKQTALAISTTEAEYIIAGKACQQALWMKQALINYDVLLDDVPIMCDNKGAIDLSKNPVQHSRTKHIKIRHHFLRDNVQKEHISIEKVPSVAQYPPNSY
ncbi:hypothetical protein Tco_0019252 [Tanacetum coccineum]